MIGPATLIAIHVFHIQSVITLFVIELCVMMTSVAVFVLISKMSDRLGNKQSDGFTSDIIIIDSDNESRRLLTLVSARWKGHRSIARLQKGSIKQ